MAVNMQLDEEETKTRIRQGLALSKVTGRERTTLARDFRIASSSNITDFVQIAKMFASEDSPFRDNMKFIAKTKWTALIVLSRVKNTDPILRMMLAHLVLDYVECSWNDVESFFGIKDDQKTLTTIIGHPDIYRKDVQVLFAKLKNVKGWEMTPEERQLALLPTPDLPAKIKAHLETVASVPQGQIEAQLDEIRSTINAIDTGIVDLEVNKVSNQSNVALPQEFMQKVLTFIDGFEFAEAALATNDNDALIIANQQRQIEALQKELSEITELYNAIAAEKEQLLARNTELSENFATVQSALSLILEKIPQERVADPSLNGTEATTQPATTQPATTKIDE